MLKIVDACGISYQIEDTLEARKRLIKQMNEHRHADSPNFRLETANHQNEYFLFNEETDVIIKVRLFAASSISRSFIVRKEATVKYLARLCGCVYWPWAVDALLKERFTAKIIGLDYEVAEDMKIQTLVDAKVALFAKAVNNDRYFVVRVQYGSQLKAARIDFNQTLRVSNLVKGCAVIWDGQELSPKQRLETLDLCPEKGHVEIVESRRDRAPKDIMRASSNAISTFYRYANEVLAEQEDMVNAVVYYSKDI